MDINEQARQLQKLTCLNVVCFLRTVNIVMFINEQSSETLLCQFEVVLSSLGSDLHSGPALGQCSLKGGVV